MSFNQNVLKVSNIYFSFEKGDIITFSTQFASTNATQTDETQIPWKQLRDRIKIGIDFKLLLRKLLRKTQMWVKKDVWKFLRGLKFYGLSVRLHFHQFTLRLCLCTPLFKMLTCGFGFVVRIINTVLNRMNKWKLSWKYLCPTLAKNCLLAWILFECLCLMLFRVVFRLSFWRTLIALCLQCTHSFRATSASTTY